jgi:RNA polymerase sigma-70 factor, ECF subfamily
LSDDFRDLVRRCLSGEEEAMAALVEAFRPQVFGLCYRMLGQRQDAEDAAQETFVRALRSLRRWDQQREFAPWLFAIAGNRCRTVMAARMNRPRLAPLPDEQADGRPDPHAAGAMAEEVGLALAGLRPEYRQAFTLFHEQEMSYLEIAAALDCPVGTAKTWVHRARRELTAALRARGILGKSADAMPRV